MNDEKQHMKAADRTAAKKSETAGMAEAADAEETAGAVRALNERLLRFLSDSPCCFQAIDALAARFRENGFTELSEKNCWSVGAGNYFVTRNHSALIAFTIPKKLAADKEKLLAGGFYAAASHSDSPSFKIKENPEIAAEGKYVTLNVEKYGGMLCAPWFDRPLSVAGRVFAKTADGIREKLVNVDRDTLLIPNVAIHMNRKANEGYAYNAQADMLPLFGTGAASGRFMALVAEAAGVSEKDILGHDLFLYNRTAGSIWGTDGEFISAPRLDDLQCAFAAAEGFLSGKRSSHVSLFCVFDNEETGSETKQGAGSTFLYDTLQRICSGLSLSYEEYLVMLRNGFLVSADNAHAMHPNHKEFTDPTNRPYINGGIVIKYNAQQKYCTDGASAAFFKALCEEAGVPYQSFVNRSDMPGGSTLGNISNLHVAFDSVDIGLAQLAMHSPYETAGTLDTACLVKAMTWFFA